MTPHPPRRAPVVAIVGATGAVGIELLHCLERRRFPLAAPRLHAWARSVGKTLPFKGAELAVQNWMRTASPASILRSFPPAAPQPSDSRRRRCASAPWWSTTPTGRLEVSDIVFCKVRGRYIDAHRIAKKADDGRSLKSHNRGYDNAWTREVSSADENGRTREFWRKNPALTAAGAMD